MSREKFRKQVRKELEASGIEVTEERVNSIAELRVKEEINRGVQMIQYAPVPFHAHEVHSIPHHRKRGSETDEY